MSFVHLKYKKVLNKMEEKIFKQAHKTVCTVAIYILWSKGNVITDKIIPNILQSQN